MDNPTNDKNIENLCKYFEESFKQDELMTITYLILEKIIFNKLSYELDTKDLINDLGVFKKDTFLYYYLLAFTRKVEVRNYISSILLNSS